jgi:hypothetical protein
MNNQLRFVWIRVGDHKAEAEQMIQQNARDHRGKVIGDPTVLVRTGKLGAVTVLSASGHWWHEHLAVRTAWGIAHPDNDDVVSQLVEHSVAK